MSDFNFGEQFESAPSRLLRLRQERTECAKKSLPFRISFLDDIAVGILPTDLVVLGAATGAGKSTLGLLMTQAACKHGTRVHYFALEAHEGEIEQRLLYREMSNIAWKNKMEGRHTFSYAHWVNGQCNDIALAVEDEARIHLSKDIEQLHTYYRSSKFTVKQLVRLMGEIRSQTDLIVVDHLHFIDNDESDENRGMKAIVKSVSDAIQDVKVPIIAIAHLRKKDSHRPRLVPDIDDFHGSSDIVKIATKAIVIAPARDQTPLERHIVQTYMRVAKDRLVGETGLTGLLTFDLRSHSYHSEYQLGRLNYAGEQWEALAESEHPWWATKAVRPAG